MAIYVIEDHPLMREAVSTLARRIRPGAEIVELSDLVGIDQSLSRHGTPELFCLDLKLPEATGVDGIRRLKELFPSVPLAVITAAPAGETEQQCLEAGADVYIEKSTSPIEIAAALRTVLTAETVPSELDYGSSDLKPETRLSKRQFQLVAMLDQGLTNRDIAERLGISEHTVKVHLWRLFRRIGVKSRTQALHYARIHGLLDQ